jgi:hypothetical protein
MRAWQLERLGGSFELRDVPVPEPRPGSVVVQVEASALMSYMKDYVEGKLPIYNPPKGTLHSRRQRCWSYPRRRSRCLASEGWSESCSFLSFHCSGKRSRSGANPNRNYWAGFGRRTSSGRLARWNFGRLCIVARRRRDAG